MDAEVRCQVFTSSKRSASSLKPSILATSAGHRPPMSLVDSALDESGKSIKCVASCVKPYLATR